MPAYLIARVEVTDADAYETYKSLAAPAIARYGGRYLARGGAMHTLEGQEESRRVVIVEFDGVEQARRFYDSPEYLEARRAREGAAKGQFLVIDGV